MSWLFDGIEARVVDVLENERGRTGLGTAAAARYIPAGWFRRSVNKQSIRDVTYPGGAFDRAYYLEFVSIGDYNGIPENTLDPYSLKEISARLHVGYIYGDALTNAVVLAPATSETADTAVEIQRTRALSESDDVIVYALCFPDIFQDDTLEPKLIDCARDGASICDDLGGGRLVCVTPLKIWVQKTNGARRWPQT